MHGGKDVDHNIGILTWLYIQSFEGNCRDRRYIGVWAWLFHRVQGLFRLLLKVYKEFQLLNMISKIGQNVLFDIDFGIIHFGNRQGEEQRVE